jgi:hypothetical protein
MNREEVKQFWANFRITDLILAPIKAIDFFMSSYLIAGQNILDFFRRPARQAPENPIGAVKKRSEKPERQITLKPLPREEEQKISTPLLLAFNNAKAFEICPMCSQPDTRNVATQTDDLLDEAEESLKDIVRQLNRDKP